MKQVRPYVCPLIDFPIWRCVNGKTDESHLKWLLVRRAESVSDAIRRARIHLQHDPEAKLARTKGHYPDVRDARPWTPDKFPYEEKPDGTNDQRPNPTGPAPRTALRDRLRERAEGPAASATNQTRPAAANLETADEVE